MECINIRVNNGRVDVTVDGAKLTDVRTRDRRGQPRRRHRACLRKKA